MDLYTLDNNFLQTNIIDDFDSLIWTERYNAAGDVTLVVASTDDFKSQLYEGVFLYTPVSKEVMFIDSVSDENGVLTITGSSLIGFLKHRILRDTWQRQTTEWPLTGTPAAMATTVIQQMCMPGGYMATDVVLPPGAGAKEIFPTLTIGPTVTDGTSQSISLAFGNVYDGIKTICDLDDIGFTMYPPSITDGSGNLIFSTYRGRDMTSDQSVRAPVIFEPAADSYADIKELRSIAGYATAAYAWPQQSPNPSYLGSAFVPGTQLNTGFTRQSLMVTTDVDTAYYVSAGLDYRPILNQKAMDALANNNYVKLLDGQLVPQSQFVYGKQYLLGDIIELRGTTTITQQARVTEYVRSQDATGERGYPTLSVIS